MLRDPDRRELRIVEPLQHHEMAAGINDGDRHSPAVLHCFSLG
jgi:hypothetical protein